VPQTPSSLHVGIAGCGRVAALHLGAISRVAGVEVVAVADVDLERARRAAEPFGGATVHDRCEDLAADPGVDLVAVCAPPAAHAAVAAPALAAGKHVLVEKPVTLDPAEADALIDAVQPGAVACVGFNLRLHRQIRLARRAIADGRLGRLLMIRGHWIAAPRPPGWRSDPASGGGALWEMGIHHLDLWRHLTGAEPVDTAATGDADALVVTARTDDGVLLASTLACGSSDVNDVELIGERGRLTLTLFRGDGPVWSPVGRAAGGVSVRLRSAARTAATLPRQARAARAGGDYILSFAAEWEAVRDAVRVGRPPHATLEDGRAATALAARAQAAMTAAEAPA
jgi:predicted dehydrogenase